MALLAYLVIYLYLHACAARPLMVRDKEIVTQLQLSREDVKTSVAGRFLRRGDKASDHDANVVRLDNRRFSSDEDENMEGKEVKTSYSWKILQQETGTETWKRADRSTLESPPSDAEENVRSNDNDAVDNIVAMDYAQPHRKPPIHNKGT